MRRATAAACRAPRPSPARPAARDPRRPPRVTRSTGSRMPMTPGREVEHLRPAGTPSAAATASPMRRLVRVARRARWPRWRCRTWRRRPSRSRRPRPCRPSPARLARDSRTGAAANAVRREDRGRGTPARRPRRRARGPGVRDALIPAVVPAGDEAGRDPRDALDRGSVGGERREERIDREGHRRASRCGRARRRATARAAAGGGPAVSGRPWTTLNAWIAWPAAPLTRLSRTPIARTRPVRSSTRHQTRDSLLPRTCFVAGGVLDDRDERLVVVRRRRRARRARPGSPAGSCGRGRRTRMPRVIGIEVRQEVDAADARVRAGVPATAPSSSCSISPMWRCVNIAVRLDALVDLAEVEVRLGVAAGAGHAALGVDDDVADEAGARERREGEDRGRRVAARASRRSRRGASPSRGQLRRGGAPAGRRRRPASSSGRGMVEVVPASGSPRRRGAGSRARGR